MRVSRAVVLENVRRWGSLPGLLLVGLSSMLILAACGGSGGGSDGGSGGGAAPVVAPVIVTQPQSIRVNDGQNATFSVTAVSAATPTYQWSRGGVAIAGATGSTYTVAPATLGDDGATFSVSVTNAGGTAQSGLATLNVSVVAPSIANNAARTVSVLEGQPATFSVTAAGSSPLSFQWRRGGVAIAGANASSYTLPAALATDNGAVFDVVITNAAGSVTSAPLTLAVTVQATAPTIATQPQPVTLRVGESATFTVAAAGTAPFAYQWLRNGVAIAGAQSASFVLTNAMLGDNGALFSVTVSNSAGSATSAAARLTVLPQPGIASIAGTTGGPGGIDGTGPDARFTSPSAVALDNAGNLFIADATSVRKVGTNGAVTTFAGSPISSGSIDGSATVARFGLPSGIAVDAAGNVYVADNTNSTIRRITAAGVVTTFAGTAAAPGSADGTGPAASFNVPVGVAVDGAGNVYVGDTGNHTIRKITPAGVVTTLAGTPGASGAADGVGPAARFDAPRGVAVDAAANVYVADSGNNTIRVITPAGVVTTLAGRAGTSGSTDGVGPAASFNTPSGVSLDAAGNVYVGEIGSRIVRKVTPAGLVTIVAGSANVIGNADGTGTAAQFALPSGVASDASGALYVADRENFEVRRISTTAVVSAYVGSAILQGNTDATGAAARFSVPFGIAADAAGNVFVADYFDATIRRVTAAGVVTTLAGQAGATGSVDGTGAAARFATPQGVAIDAAGNLYVADKVNQTIRKVTPAGVVSTLAGSPGVSGATDGSGSGATFNAPSAVVVDAAGNVYVADNNPTLRRISPAGVVTTIAGAAGRYGAVDGPGNVASFRFPQGLAIDAAGNVYLADAGNAIVRKITSAGVVTTIAGVAGQSGSNDGSATTARFTLPTGIAIDAGGNVFVSDIGTHTIRRIDAAGNVTTPVGVADGIRGVRTGALPGHLDLPVALAFDASGNLYCTDANAVLRITFP